MKNSWKPIYNVDDNIMNPILIYSISRITLIHFILQDTAYLYKKIYCFSRSKNICEGFWDSQSTLSVLNHLNGYNCLHFNRFFIPISALRMNRLHDNHCKLHNPWGFVEILTWEPPQFCQTRRVYYRVRIVRFMYKWCLNDDQFGATQNSE